jgi:MraZ protein
MPEFSNQYYATIDDKGRVVLPSAYKRELGDSFEWLMIVELDPYEKCLNLYSMNSWGRRVDLIKSKLNSNNPRHSRFLDQFYQNFVKITVAENGRLNIPNAYYEKKGITKDVVFTGQGDRIRLWDADVFRKAIMPDDEFRGMFEEFLGGGQ